MDRSDKVRFGISSANWLWLFAPAFPLHAIEEIKGVGALHGINLSLTKFFVTTGGSSLLMIAGILLAFRFGFPQFLAVVLATGFLLNGISHVVNTLRFSAYDAGVITGTLIFIPLGIATMIGLRNNMGRQRFLAAIAIGITLQGIAMVLAL